MLSFHHGGRLGDCLYALYTVKQLGGGDLTLSTFQQGNWDTAMIESLLPLVEYQDYIGLGAILEGSQAEIKAWAQGVDYDLHEAELDFNPEAFPEWQGDHWPGNCHIAKRYAVHFGVAWEPESVWLTAPKTKDVDIVVHAPLRRLPATMPPERFAWPLRGFEQYKVVVIGGPHDYAEWRPYLPLAQFVQPKDMLEAADWINSAKFFVGTASSGNVIAEGLKQKRFVAVADGCFNTYPAGKTGAVMNNWSPTQTVAVMAMALNEEELYLELPC